tara:strand:- start:358 stop:681 length:324 start_codon:yes stop_codon:yes gene_type:complete
VRNLSFGQARERTAFMPAALAVDLTQSGIGAGDRICLLMGNSAQIVIATFGVQVVQLNPSYMLPSHRPMHSPSGRRAGEVGSGPLISLRWRDSRSEKRAMTCLICFG